MCEIHYINTAIHSRHLKENTQIIKSSNPTTVAKKSFDNFILLNIENNGLFLPFWWVI
jgi:hypothetical protein